MLWRGRRESSNVVDQRKFGAGSLGVGGLLIGAVVYYFMGGNPIVYLVSNASSVGSSQSSMSQSANEQDDDRRAFVGVVLADTEDVWNAQLANSSMGYIAPKLILFRN